MGYRIGFDARFYGRAGPGRYVKALLDHLELVDTENDYIVFMNDEGFSAYTPKNPKFKKVLVNSSWYSFQEQTKFLVQIMRQKLDLYYAPHFNVPILYPGKLVTAIPDMIMHEYGTEFSTTLPKWYFKIKKFVYKWVFYWAMARSYKVIVPSEGAINKFLDNFPFKKDKYVLASEGVDPDLFDSNLDPANVLEKYGVTQPYLLFVSSMYEHKNINRLIEAFKVLMTKYKYEGTLVLISKRDKFSDRVYEKIKAERLDSRILMPAYKFPSKAVMVISDAEVVAFRKKAQAYVFPSLMEGFSLTALEGMHLGLPATISNIDIHKEVHGDSVLYFDPYVVEDIAHKMHLIVSDNDLRQKLITRGYEQVKKYSWDNTANVTLNVFKQALSNSSKPEKAQ